MDCRHKPKCPDATPDWHCYKRGEIETAVLHGTLDRETAAHLLAKFGLPIRPQTATERYNLEAKRVEKGLLF